MNLKEATSLLSWKRELVELAIVEGVETPRTKVKVKLVADQQGSDFDILDDELDRFLAAFEKEEPGRNPPVSVRRELLVECGFQCAVCESDAPLRFHHILDWANLKHHDPKHMLAVCGSCHDKIGAGQIDTKSQRNFKNKLADASTRLRKLEESLAKIPPQDTTDWATAAHQYLVRNVEFAVVHYPTGDPEQVYVLPVANGCFVEENRVLTCFEAIELVQGVAKHKNGTAIILHGHVRHSFEVEEMDEATGLCLCKITGKDEESYEELLNHIRELSQGRDIDIKSVFENT
jgi:hypothetical protein